jgi:hypothetical protein
VGRVASTASVGFRVLNPINTTCVNANGNPTVNPPVVAGPFNNGPCSRYNVGSDHPGGMNCLLCNGSVHFLAETIEAAQGNNCSDTGSGATVDRAHPTNPELYQRLCNRKDGQPVSVP